MPVSNPLSAQDKAAQNDVRHLIFMRYNLLPARGIEVGAAWLANHPAESWQSLKQGLLEQTIFVKQEHILDLRRLPEAQLQEIAQALRGPHGVEICDRWHNSRRYKSCLIGSEAVACLQQIYDASLEEALRLGQLLIESGQLHHVVDGHGFKDEYLFYRFYCDEEA